jgi:hypothetical protein
MGTSASSGGQGGNTPLVPTWLNPSVVPSGSAPPGTPPPTIPNLVPTPSTLPGMPGALPSIPSPSPSLPAAPNPTTADPGRFQKARVNFTRFAASGGSDRRALGRSVRAYVKKATGGSTNAAMSGISVAVVDPYDHVHSFPVRDRDPHGPKQLCWFGRAQAR